MTSATCAIQEPSLVSVKFQCEFENWAAANAPWLDVAYRELGTREVQGTGRKNTNPRIAAYLRTCTLAPAHYDLRDDATSWCSAFVNWCLWQVGIKGTQQLWSLSWLYWKGGIDCGEDPARAPIGSIVVMHRGNPGEGKGHVAFLWSMKYGKPHYLGGNQGDGTLKNNVSDRVSIVHYPNKVLKCILPVRAVDLNLNGWPKTISV